MRAFLVLEDGTIFEGESVGASGMTVGEIIFNTSMTGYQEALTDPSHYGQIITMTYPLIGNCGVNAEDVESGSVHAKGLVVRELCKQPYNWRMASTLGEYLKENNVIAIEGIDTRELTKLIREKGVMNGIITTDGGFVLENYINEMKKYKISNAVKNVTCERKYLLTAEDGAYNVAVLDLGVKRSIIQALLKSGCNVTVFPAYTPAAEIIEGGFDGVVLSNGPGDPKECAEIIENIRLLQSKGIPMLGISLGHQLIALANGMDTVKMKFGHRGANYPVSHAARNRTFITSQNHGYVVANVGLDAEKAEITHCNINDGTVEGIKYKNAPVFSVQFFPGASQGTLDTGYLFGDFIKLMEGYKNA